MKELSTSDWLNPVARAGLIAKGIVYCLVGILAFMAAFHISGQSAKEADKSGVLQFVEDQPAGKWLLGLIALGLFCYTIWRIMEAFASRRKNPHEAKGYGKMIRYLFSGLGYGSFAILAVKIVLDKDKKSGGGSNQTMVAELLSKPFGQWLVGLLALVIAGIGIYQIYYGLSEKYKKHVSQLNLHSDAAHIMLRSGKIGYFARGFVWLMIAWLLAKAALHARASEAGDTSEAFQFIQHSSYGTYLLAALGAGLFCYGFFNFIRSRYETFQ